MIPFSFSYHLPSSLHYLLNLLFLHVQLCSSSHFLTSLTLSFSPSLPPAGLQEGSHVQCHSFWSYHSGAMSGALHGTRDPLQGGSMVRTHSQTGLGMRLKHPAAKLSILYPACMRCILYEAIGSQRGMAYFLSSTSLRR